MKVSASQLRSLRELSAARTDKARHRWWARVSLVTLRSLRTKGLVEDSTITPRGRDVLAGAAATRRFR